MIARPTVPYPAQRPFHSARARSYLKRGLLKRLRSLLKSLVPEAVHGGELLQTSHPPEPEHGPLPSSE